MQLCVLSVSSRFFYLLEQPVRLTGTPSHARVATQDYSWWIRVFSCRLLNTFWGIIEWVHAMWVCLRERGRQGGGLFQDQSSHPPHYQDHSCSSVLRFLSEFSVWMNLVDRASKILCDLSLKQLNSILAHNLYYQLIDTLLTYQVICDIAPNVLVPSLFSSLLNCCTVLANCLQIFLSRAYCHRA